MDIRIERLENIDQARALARCVYDVYGLTFHRSYLYEPETTLRLNQRGHLTSFIAVKGARCVGHIAAVRPYYEYTIAGSPVASDSIREVGQAMVLPHLRGEGVRVRLTEALRRWAIAEDLRGLYTRCVTHHTLAQRAAKEGGGIPSALLLAGVPFWVRYEADGGPQGSQPISTVSYYTVLRDGGEHDIWLPELDRDVYRAIYDRLEQPRVFRGEEEASPVAVATKVRVHFDPTKHQGRIHVLRAGPDVAELVIQRYRWLMAGRIQHVLLLAPLDNPFVARAVTAWKGEGMIFGGVLPHLMGADAAIYQGVREVDLRPDAIQVIDPLAVTLRSRAIEDWRFSRDMQRPAPAFRGIAKPGSVL